MTEEAEQPHLLASTRLKNLIALVAWGAAEDAAATLVATLLPLLPLPLSMHPRSDPHRARLAAKEEKGTTTKSP
jgi:hypothetical protein